MMEMRFETYLEHLYSALGHADQSEGLRETLIYSPPAPTHEQTRDNPLILSPTSPWPMQARFSDLEYAAKKKLTRRDRFLAGIHAVTGLPRPPTNHLFLCADAV